MGHVVSGNGGVRLIGVMWCKDAGKGWKLDDGMDVRLNLAAVGVWSTGGLLRLVETWRREWVVED